MGVDFSGRDLQVEHDGRTYNWHLESDTEGVRGDDGTCDHMCEACDDVVAPWYVTSQEDMGSQENFCGNCACQLLGEDVGRYPSQ